MPTVILASRFNNLKTRVDRVLGPCLETNTSSGDYTFGYGETPSSYLTQSASNDLIDAAAYQGLYLDVAKVKIHQVGTSAFTPLAYKIGDFVTNAATADKVEEAYIAGIESLATDIENNKFDCHATQADLLPCDTSITSTNWNGTLSHIFTVTFTSAQERREYFNAGGLIRFNPSMTYSGSQAKTLDWKSMINAIGAVNFGCQGTIAPSGVGQSYAGIGHDYMSSVYQTAYFNQGGGVYNPNRYTIYAMELSDTVLQFKVELTDPSYGNPDENVLASVVNLVQFFRPNGTAIINGVNYTTVQRSTPTSSTISAF